MANYQANTYGNYLNAYNNQPTGAQTFGQIAGGIGNIATPFMAPLSSKTLTSSPR